MSTICRNRLLTNSTFLSVCRWYIYFILIWGKCYGVQHYVIKFVNDLRQVGGFLPVLRFPQPIKLTTTI